LAAEALAGAPELRDEAEAVPLLDRIRTVGRRVELEDAGTSLYLLEGDLLFDEDEINLYALQRQTLERNNALGTGDTSFGTRANALVISAPGNRKVRWKPGMDLGYCVLQQSFLDEAHYEMVRENMIAATEAWEAVCGITFDYREEHDDHTNVSAVANDIADDLVFTVRNFDSQGQFIAAAFFPTYPPARRKIYIDPSYYHPDLGYDKAGVLRHELGHVLGFRHEHIRSGAPPGCPDEPMYDTVTAGDYDPDSVMHYFCGGLGTKDLEITELDRQGAQSVYGPPLDDLMIVT
jgi:hypothetical protein